MNSFSISELQQYSGIKAHTIRIWEQRYDALTPSRSDGNTRQYDDLQLRRLLNIVSLMSQGFKVSELGRMPDKKINELLGSALIKEDQVHDVHDYLISQIVAAALGYNEPAFDKTFSNAILRFGLKQAYVSVLYPALVRLGMMWSNDTIRPAHEHFISNLIRQKIAAATDALPFPKPGRRPWLLFLPEDELHETGLLFANFLIRSAGTPTAYLGAGLPFDSLRTAASTLRPGNLLTFFVRNRDKEADQQYISELAGSFSNVPIHVACASGRLIPTKEHKNVRFLENIDQLMTHIQ